MRPIWAHSFTYPNTQAAQIQIIEFGFDSIIPIIYMIMIYWVYIIGFIELQLWFVIQYILTIYFILNFSWFDQVQKEQMWFPLIKFSAKSQSLWSSIFPIHNSGIFPLFSLFFSILNKSVSSTLVNLFIDYEGNLALEERFDLLCKPLLLKASWALIILLLNIFR